MSAKSVIKTSFSNAEVEQFARKFSPVVEFKYLFNLCKMHFSAN